VHRRGCAPAAAAGRSGGARRACVGARWGRRGRRTWACAHGHTRRRSLTHARPPTHAPLHTLRGWPSSPSSRSCRCCSQRALTVREEPSGVSAHRSTSPMFSSSSSACAAGGRGGRGRSRHVRMRTSWGVLVGAWSDDVVRGRAGGRVACLLLGTACSPGNAQPPPPAKQRCRGKRGLHGRLTSSASLGSALSLVVSESTFSVSHSRIALTSSGAILSKSSNAISDCGRGGEGSGAGCAWRDRDEGWGA